MELNMENVPLVHYSFFVLCVFPSCFTFLSLVDVHCLILSFNFSVFDLFAQSLVLSIIHLFFDLYFSYWLFACYILPFFFLSLFFLSSYFLSFFLPFFLTFFLPFSLSVFLILSLPLSFSPFLFLCFFLCVFLFHQHITRKLYGACLLISLLVITGSQRRWSLTL